MFYSLLFVMGMVQQYFEVFLGSYRSVYGHLELLLICSRSVSGEKVVGYVSGIIAKKVETRYVGNTNVTTRGAI